jgi:hypothetical protein
MQNQRHSDSSVTRLMATASHLITHTESQIKAFVEVRRSANDRDSKYAALITCPRSLMICFVGIVLFANPAVCFPCLGRQFSHFKFLGWAITDFCRRSLLGIASICHSAKGQSPAVSRQDSRRSTTKDVP